MRNHLRQLVLTISMLFFGLSTYAQVPILIHSHNDYDRDVPFYEAYSLGAASIEADVFYIDGKLLVGHDIEDLNEDQTLENTYIEPAVKLFRKHGGKPYKDENKTLQLMIELKSEPISELKAVQSLLEKYPDVFNPAVNENAIRIVITGRRPAPSQFKDFPKWINFDGEMDLDYTPDQIKRVALYSLDFGSFFTWNGKGLFLPEEYKVFKQKIEYAHNKGKGIRFYGAPEGTTVYYTFYNDNVDYINVDDVVSCAKFFDDFENKNFRLGKREVKDSQHRNQAKILDKLTRDFVGWQNDKLKLSKGVEIYEPKYVNDGEDKPIKNIIFLIGDGMGLNQITAGAYANDGLSLFNMKYIGFQINHALDAFTTDSAAGGSALATGEPHYNRHVSCSVEGEPIPSMSDYFRAQGKSIGVLTLGNACDATPAAYYGHSVERDDSDTITKYLLNTPVDVLCGSGIDQFLKDKRKDGLDIIPMLEENYDFITDYNEINTTHKNKSGKVICIDEKMGDAAEEANLSLLRDATKETIKKLESQSDKGFFLMVEGAKIDYAGHARCLPGCVLEMLSFDMAIAEAMKFADENGETLVIVTADHETGGLILLDGDRSTGRVTGVFTTNDHTPTVIPVFAYGPGSKNFIGTYMNTEIAKTIKKLLP